MTREKGLAPGTRKAWAAEQQGLHKCGCGCGGAISIRLEHFSEGIPRFMHGHNRLGQRKPPPERLNCQCGCGLLAQPGKAFISGHNTRIRSHTEETKEKIRQSKLGDRNPRFGMKPWNDSGKTALPCRCGCGGLTTPGRSFIMGHNVRGTRMKNYRGWFASQGYIWIHAEDHPFASDGYVREHRLVAEQHLRETQPGSPFLIQLGYQLYLSPDAVVHHVDGVKDHNEIENLQVMTSEEHTALHHRQGDISR